MPDPAKSPTKHAKLQPKDSWIKGDLHKSREDSIARQVFWMALITHIGRRTNMSIGIKKRCAFGPNVRYTINLYSLRVFLHQSDDDNDKISCC